MQPYSPLSTAAAVMDNLSSQQMQVILQPPVMDLLWEIRELV